MYLTKGRDPETPLERGMKGFFSDFLFSFANCRSGMLCGGGGEEVNNLYLFVFIEYHCKLSDNWNINTEACVTCPIKGVTFFKQF